MSRSSETTKSIDVGLRQFIARSPVAVAMFDQELKYLAVSEKWCSDYELEQPELIGRSQYEISPEIPAAWKAVHQRALRGETTRVSEDKYLCANGSEQWLAWEVQPWFLDDGTIGGIVIFSEIITQQKVAEQKSRLLAEIRIAFNNSDNPQAALRIVCGKILDYLQCDLFLAYLLDGDRKRLQLQAHHGVTATEVPALQTLDTTGSFSGAALSQQNSVVIENVEQSQNAEAKSIHALGITAYACFPLESDNSVLGTISFGSKKRACFSPSELELMSAMSEYVATSMQRIVDRAALKERNASLQAVLNSVTDAIVSIDQHGVIMSVNPATCRIFGYQEAELIGRKVSILMPSPYRDEHDRYIQNYLKTGQAKIIGLGRELTGMRRNGETFPIDLTVTEIDHLQMFTGVVRDISERKALQSQLLEIASSEQRRIGQELHDGIGQELTGLTLLAGTVKRLLAGNAPPESNKTNAAQLQAAVVQLVQGLAETNRHVHHLSHGIMPVQIDAQGLRSALEELLAKLQSQDERLTCRLVCAEDFSVSNNTIATQLYRVVQEALNNAIRHGHATAIDIVVQQDEQQTTLEIKDNGCGFDPQIFLTPHLNNGGMGLRIMQHRMNTIGGIIRAESREPQGMTIRCTLLK